MSAATSVHPSFSRSSYEFPSSPQLKSLLLDHVWHMRITLFLKRAETSHLAWACWGARGVDKTLPVCLSALYRDRHILPQQIVHKFPGNRLIEPKNTAALAPAPTPPSFILEVPATPQEVLVRGPLLDNAVQLPLKLEAESSVAKTRNIPKQNPISAEKAEEPGVPRKASPSLPLAQEVFSSADLDIRMQSLMSRYPMLNLEEMRTFIQTLPSEDLSMFMEKAAEGLELLDLVGVPDQEKGLFLSTAFSLSAWVIKESKSVCAQGIVSYLSKVYCFFITTFPKEMAFWPEVYEKIQMDLEDEIMEGKPVDGFLHHLDEEDDPVLHSKVASVLKEAAERERALVVAREPVLERRR